MDDLISTFSNVQAFSRIIKGLIFLQAVITKMDTVDGVVRTQQTTLPTQENNLETDREVNIGSVRKDS
jgi:hypothetical protein